MRKRKNRDTEQHPVSAAAYGMTVLILAVLLAASVLLSITFGNADISVADVYKVVFRELFHIRKFDAYHTGAVHDVVWLIRFPRVMLAIAVGMALSVCGAVMQAIVKNPLADPYVLGISSGAEMGATLAILFGVGAFLGAGAVGAMAFLGAMLTSFAVLFIANTGGPSNAGKLILAGMAVSAVCSAFSSFFIYLANNKDATAQITFWMMGSLGGASWSEVPVILPVVLAGVIVFWTQSRNLNLMLLGDETSITLGTNLQKIRSRYMVLASLMIGIAVYSAGTIGFVGLIVPHVVRMFFGTDHRRLIPLTALVGAVFLIWADVACRVILPNSEMPIGILISMIGAPCFIYLMASKSYGFGGSQ